MEIGREEGKNRPLKVVVTNDDKTKDTYTDNFILFAVNQEGDLINVNVSEKFSMSNIAYEALGQCMNQYVTELITWLLAEQLAKIAKIKEN